MIQDILTFLATIVVPAVLGYFTLAYGMKILSKDM